MFSDLKKGSQVHVLDTTGVPKYRIGKIIDKSDPKYVTPQPGNYNMQTRVIDLVVDIDGENKTYTVPENQNVGKASGIMLSCMVDPIINEINSIKSMSEDIIKSVPENEAKIKECEVILEDINPAYKQYRNQDKKIANIEERVGDLSKSFDELKKLIIEKFKQN